MSTNKPTPKKKSQTPSKKVAQKVISGAPAKKAAATSPKLKQKPGPKKGSTRKAQPEKKAVVKKVAPKSKGASFKPNAKDGDGDGFIQDSTEHERRKPGAAEELNAMAKKYKQQIDKGSLRFLEQATTSANNAIPQVDLRISLNDAVASVQPNTKPYGTASKKKGILSRITSWFRPSKKKNTGKKR